MASQHQLPGKLGKLFSVMAEDYGRKGNSRLRDLLQKSEYSVEEEATYDNWNGGTYGHAVHFEVPGDVYFEIIDNLAEIGKELAERVNALSTVRNEFVSEVTIEIKDHPHSVPHKGESEHEETTKPLAIPERLRQDIFDFLKIEGIHWSGNLDDTEFLQRLYDLSALESHDSRFPDAAGDIWQHRVNNPFDWDDDWVFGDPRFDLLHTDDEAFLRFLCEMIHPVVRRDLSEVNRIRDAFNQMLSPTGWQIMGTTQIGDRPVFSPLSGIASATGHSPAKTEVMPTVDTELDRVWGLPGFFRIFLSHKAEHKVETAKLKKAFLKCGVACFVAHEDIEPTREWQDEIENALFSMEACVVLLTPDFHASYWTDQEVGVAIGRRVPIITVRLGIDPYGFIGKYQAVKGGGMSPVDLSKTVYALLLANASIHERLADATLTAFENADSYDCANELIEYVEKLPAISQALIERLESAPNSIMFS